MKGSEVTIKQTKPVGSNVAIKKKEQRHMGNISIDETQLPEIKNWQVGEEYEMIVKVRQTEIREVDNWEKEQYGLPEKGIIGRFEIISASPKSEGSNKYKK